MNKNDPRKAYWNEQYVKYWRSRVDEAGTGESGIIEGDTNTEEDSVYESIFEHHGFNQGRLLEVGCAWGRMFPLYLKYDLEISGVDISEAMISEAKKAWNMHKNVKCLQASPAEDLPFDDEYFDNLSCIAVLDATYQDQAITEFLRVTRPGARIYFTGKNDSYYQDDKKAYDAEVGARNKNHPNFFTDTQLLIKLLEEQGHKVEESYFFPRRGDFARFHYETKPEHFYEYLLVIKRGDNFSELPKISDTYSKTYKELNK